MKPLVAVTTTVVPEAGPYQRPQVTLYAIYLDVLERVGLGSVLLTPAHSLETLPALLDRCDGLVLTGGEDVDPARYGESPLPGLGLVNPERDEMEFAALRLALERRLPILAICRGCQLLNVAFGGTLYQDLPTQRPGGVRHRQREAWEKRTHVADVVRGSLLSKIVESDRLLINSFHHQGIKDVGEGLEVVAVAEDGTVEALEAPSYPWVLGVQWHPERHEAVAPEPDPDRRIFQAFYDAVANRGRSSHRGRTVGEAA